MQRLIQFGNAAKATLCNIFNVWQIISVKDQSTEVFECFSVPQLHFFMQENYVNVAGYFSHCGNVARTVLFVL